MKLRRKDIKRGMWLTHINSKTDWCVAKNKKGELITLWSRYSIGCVELEFTIAEINCQFKRKWVDENE